MAPRQFHEALAGFVEHKRRRLPTEIVNLQHALAAESGSDDPERLKRFLYQRWRKGGLGYVLLVGDADVLPVRFMVLDRVTPAAFDYAFYPSDLYYSDLARADGRFDDWNASREGFHARYYGEVRGEKNKTDPINFDQVDYRPDVALGRWPVSQAEEVRLVAEKTMRYEQALAQAAARQGPAGRPRAALFSVQGWVDSRGTMDLVAGQLAPAWQVEKRYFADALRNDRTPPPGEAELAGLLHEGLGLVFHAGHGTDDTWEHCFSAAQIAELRNGQLPVMVSAGCSTARFCTLPPYEPYLDSDGGQHAGTNFGQVFDAPPPPPHAYQADMFNRSGLGERLLRGGPAGAVAYIGCNTGSQPCGLSLLEGFARAVAASRRPVLGDCWSGAVAFYYDKERLADLKPNDHWYPPSIFFQGMKFMLFGDPSLPLPGNGS